MPHNSLEDLAREYLDYLCLGIPERRTGSSGNRLATRFFTATITQAGFEVEEQEFDCLDWSCEGVTLRAAGEEFVVFPSPLTPGCRVSAPLVLASTLDELEAAEAGGCLLLLRGDIAAEPLMPKNFPFYNPEHHQRIIHLLEGKQPAAVLTATGRNPEMAGGVYPFPMLEDGDFDIPSIYMTAEEGERLAENAAMTAELVIHAQRIPAKGINPIARQAGNPARRIVVCAHIDSKEGTPGAVDNATGVVVLLLLAHLLRDYHGMLGVEILTFNGEDYYSAAGQVRYLEVYGDTVPAIVLAVNLDGAGYRQGGSAYSLYGCSDNLGKIIKSTFAKFDGLAEGPLWYQGDHMVFVLNQRPALAITSEQVATLMSRFTHTPQDRPEIVDPAKLVEIAAALQHLILELDAHLQAAGSEL
jgi:aminopeptidase YwaD